VATTELEVSDGLRRSGIHSLLGVRLAPGHRLVGVLYIGLSETRAFSPRQIRRLEALGERLTLHLDNAKLHAELLEKIEALGTERDLRERFVSVLAHDLRGPLSAAKMNAHLLIRHPEALDERRAIAIKYGAPDKPVTITVERTDGGVEASVHNHGSLLSREDRAQVFEPFARTRSAQTGSARGCGLGLTLVHACAEAHGGRVRVDSDAA